MHSARTVLESWYKAYDYCNKSSARLVKISSDSEFLGFIRDLAKQINRSSFWIGSPRGAHYHQSGSRKCVKFDGKGTTQAKCTVSLPFICERGERVMVP